MNDEIGMSVAVWYDASMRPRVFPAENAQKSAEAAAVGVASMRPRVFPAENVESHQVIAGPRDASMRPRVFPAENTIPPEAAGIPRGKQFAQQRRSPTLAIGYSAHASMRPRVFPAEKRRHDHDHAVSAGCFNEAAGIPRGKRPHLRAVRYCFNEAAGIPRGKRAAALEFSLQWIAARF